MQEFRPVQENFLWRNLVYDDIGDWTNGVGRNSRRGLPYSALAVRAELPVHLYELRPSSAVALRKQPSLLLWPLH